MKNTISGMSLLDFLHSMHFNGVVCAKDQSDDWETCELFETIQYGIDDGYQVKLNDELINFGFQVFKTSESTRTAIVEIDGEFYGASFYFYSYDCGSFDDAFFTNVEKREYLTTGYFQKNGRNLIEVIS